MRTLVFFGMGARHPFITIQYRPTETICIVRLRCQVLVTGSETKSQHQCDIITFKPYNFQVAKRTDTLCGSEHVSQQGDVNPVNYWLCCKQYCCHLCHYAICVICSLRTCIFMQYASPVLDGLNITIEIQ